MTYIPVEIAKYLLDRVLNECFLEDDGVHYLQPDDIENKVMRLRKELTEGG